MSWVDVFTSFDGRLTRKPFWIAFLCLLLPEVLAHLATDQRGSSVVSLLLAYPQFAVFTKRGRDRDVPAWVPGLFIAGGAVLDLLVLLDLIGPLTAPNALFYALGVPLAVMGLVLLADFGFRRGTVGTNRYGRDPLEPHRVGMG